MGANHTAARKRVETEVGFIYLAKVPRRRQIVKIGFSLDPEKRAKALGCRLMAAVPGTLKQEQQIHRDLYRMRVHGCECYPRSILAHDAIPAGLRGAA